MELFRNLISESMFFALGLITFAERHATFSDLYFNRLRLHFTNQTFQIVLEMSDRKIPLIVKKTLSVHHSLQLKRK